MGFLLSGAVRLFCKIVTAEWQCPLLFQFRPFHMQWHGKRVNKNREGNCTLPIL